jgi:hypothetical protein
MDDGLSETGLEHYAKGIEKVEELHLDLLRAVMMWKHVVRGPYESHPAPGKKVVLALAEKIEGRKVYFCT